MNASDIAYTPSISALPNSSCAEDGQRSSQSFLMQVGTQTLAIFIMVGLGCTCDFKIMWAYMKQPKQIATGLGMQLLLFPLLGLGLSQAFSFTQAQAMGAIISCSCPGGAFSNIATYWLDGDMDLSMVLTALSTAIALGTMPLWLHLLPLAIGIADDCLQIPFQELGLSFLGLIIPASVGVLIKFKFPRAAKIISKICIVVTSIGMCFFSVFFFTKLAKEFLQNPPWNVVLAAVLMPLLAAVFSYLATRVPWLTFNMRARRTVAIETLIQNSALGMSVTFLSYDIENPFFGQILTFTVCFNISQMLIVLLFVLPYVLCKWRGWCKEIVPEEEEKDRLKKAKIKEVSKELLTKDKPENMGPERV